jgi:hypothetical protein
MQNVAALAAEIVQGKGYVLLPELFPPEEISTARSRILQLATAAPVTGKAGSVVLSHAVKDLSPTFLAQASRYWDRRERCANRLIP